jgi:hypothetical protein
MKRISNSDREYIELKKSDYDILLVIGGRSRQILEKEYPERYQISKRSCPPLVYQLVYVTHLYE